MKAKLRAWFVLLLLLGWGFYMLYLSYTRNSWDNFLYGFVPGLIGIWMAVYAIKDSHDGNGAVKKELAGMRAERAQERQEQRQLIKELRHEVGRLEQALVGDEEALSGR